MIRKQLQELEVIIGITSRFPQAVSYPFILRIEKKLLPMYKYNK